VNLSLTVNPIYTENLSATICEGENVQIGNSIYTTSGSYSDNLTTINGCDSIVNLSLTVNPVYTQNIAEIICEGESVQIGNSIYTTSGNYTDVLSTVNGCDSIVNLDLTVNSIYTENLSETICEGESVQVGNSIYTVSGNYTDILNTVNGCDSIVNLNLLVNPIQNETLDIELCSGELYDGISYTSNTILIDTLNAITGCDSIVTTNILVNPVYDEFVSVQICEGNAYNGVTYLNDTIILENLVTVNGCDSTIITDLQVMENDETNVPYSMCDGDSILVQGVYYTQSGSYHEIFNNQNGCDSVVNYLVEIIHGAETFVEEVICEGDSIFLAGEYQFFEGEYIEQYVAASGCDSIVTTSLILEQSIELFADDQEICFGEEVQLSIEGSNNVRWYPEEGLSCVDCTDPIANPRETTVYTVTAEGCLGTTALTTVTVFVNHPPSLTLTNNTSLLQNDEITLTAVSSDPNALITWYANGEIICEDCNEWTAEPTVSLVYLVTVENEYGCINSDEIYLDIEDGCSYSHFEVPNIISPNGDGANDFFKIKYEGVADVSLLRIYNRWGELIFETKDIETLWDGTFRGEKLNPGVFVYYFEGHCLDNKLFTKTGNITLLK
jgi:gliding motility-associated-like protein